jgi:iron complex outermembrane receptor protein
VILGLSQELEHWYLALNNTRFGNVTVTAPAGSGGENQELAAKIATDVVVSYKFTDKLSLTTNLNNIFDVYPDVTKASTATAGAGGRFPYSNEVQQIGQLGANYSLSLNYQF